MTRDGLGEDESADEARGGASADERGGSAGEEREDGLADQDQDERLRADLRDAAACLAQARRVVVYSGAGVSKESGISTFRDRDEGLWAKYDPMELATAAAYARDPAFVWGWYMDRFGLIEQAAPNPGHHALAELERLRAADRRHPEHRRPAPARRLARRDRAARQRPALQVRERSPRRLQSGRGRGQRRGSASLPSLRRPTSAPTSSGSARPCRATPSTAPSTWRRAATC